jgi:DNA-binding NtrC family response regulator
MPSSSENAVPNEPRPVEEGPGRDILIYVVDDESMIGEVVEVILKLKGFRPRFFTDPEAAFQSIVNEEPKPDLLLTDFLMSPINGMELIERCKRVQPDLKTLLYSGNVGEEIMHYYSAKLDGFLSKPFLPKTLVSVVNSVLRA